MTINGQKDQEIGLPREARETASVSGVIREIGEFLDPKRVDELLEGFPGKAEQSGLLDQLPHEFKIGDEEFFSYGPEGEEIKIEVEVIMDAALAAEDQEIIDFCKKLMGKEVYEITSAHFNEAVVILASLTCLEKEKRETVLENLKYVSKNNSDHRQFIAALFLLTTRGVVYGKELGDF